MKSGNWKAAAAERLSLILSSVTILAEMVITIMCHLNRNSPLIHVFVIFIVLCMRSLVIDSTTTISGNGSDHLALIHLRNEITGDPSEALMSWNDTVHFCDWKGVVCDRQQRQRVNILNLSSLKLSGFISPHITNLTALIELDLSHNNLRGPLPRDIGRLFHLQHLDLSGNSITGKIPTSLSNCTELEFLRFRSNEFVGDIPAELGFLPKLQVLDLFSNHLTGNISPSFGNLSSLVVLSVAYNGLEGDFPGDVGRIQSLKRLDFPGNSISGTIPLELLNISSLSYFLFAQNELHGSLPQDIGLSLPKLKQFARGLNHFTGPIPTSLSNSSELEILDFADNELSGFIPVSFGSLHKLVRLNFGDNYLETDTNVGMSFISSLTNCTSLEVLALDRNRFSGMLPDSIANLSSHLSTLSLGKNQLSGTYPSGIDRYVNLSFLSMEDNFFTGCLPVSIGMLHLLEKLLLYRNGFSGQIPSSLGNLTLLSIANLAENNFSGTIPPTIGNCQNLQELDLSCNKLNGKIPASVMSISSLTVSLNFSNNKISGPLPSEVKNLQSLGKLDLSENRLSGKIPTALGQCIGLESLMLGGNLFEGTIPSSLSALKGIIRLDISRNNLSGPVPEFLATFSTLHLLNLSFNSLEGEVPKEGVFSNASAFSIVGNYKLCGGLESLRLPSCTPQTSIVRRKHTAIKIASAIISALLLLLAACYFVVRPLMEKTRRNKHSSTPIIVTGPVQVSYAELLRATSGFSSSNLIGEGSYGSVYRGESVCNEEIIAVKIFHTQQQKHVSQIFTRECDSLRNIRHRNLIKIITSCSSIDFNGKDFKAMVYEYMPNGNLDSWLHEESHLRKLTLIERLNIAIDVASALDYLHHHCYEHIVHCNLKPSNILLDYDMNACVGDFGLARFLPEVVDDCYQYQSVSSWVKGPVGYLAPEYGTCTRASTLGDVYSYGIILLEIFTGRKPTDPIFTDGLTLHGIANSTFPDRVMEVIDPALDVHEANEEGKQVLCLVSAMRIAISCSRETPSMRMDMKDVATELRTIRDVFLGAGIHGLRRNYAGLRGVAPSTQGG